MPEVVTVSSVEKIEQLKTNLARLFKEGRYAEMTQAIGMHAVLMDAQHAARSQAALYHLVLELIKNRIKAQKGAGSAAWYSCFPEALDHLAAARHVVTDQATADVVASHRAAYGPFRSLDEFFFWAVSERRLSLFQIVRYVEKTLETGIC